MIEGVPLLLRELIVNLIDNAMKYTPNGGRVTVRTRGTEFAVLEVEDNGIGIPPEERELIFERFYRALGTESTAAASVWPSWRKSPNCIVPSSRSHRSREAAVCSASVSHAAGASSVLLTRPE